MERNYRFTLGGFVGTVSKLRKIPTIAYDAEQRFQMTAGSVRRANAVTCFAIHPKKQREFQVVCFKCFLQPADPLPDPIFKRYLAFQAVYPSAAAG